MKNRSLGSFDKIASIGMFEQVGITNQTGYFQMINRLLNPGGLYLHRAIAMSIGNLELNGFEVHDVEGWREHYARTTRLWHDRLSANRAAAEREVGSVKTRLWTLWLAASSLGFTHGTLGIFQTLASKRVRGLTDLPPTRADLYR